MSSKKIKIAFVTPLMIIGGAETYIITKCDWLIKNGFDVVVISEGGENVLNLPIGVIHKVVDKISLWPLAFSSSEYTFFINKLSKLLVENNVDVVEAHNTYPAIHVALSYKDTGIPFFINILNELSYQRNPLLALLTRQLNPFGLYYTLTSGMNSYIEKKNYSKLDPNIIPIPVKGIKINEPHIDKNYILSVCRMSKDKMYVRHLIKEFYEVYINNPKAKDYRLVIVGDGEFYNEVNSLANELNKNAGNKIIDIKGTIVGADLEILYRNCTFFVGMGTTLLLAASCGKPSVVCGFAAESQTVSWGFWGENPSDKNIIAVDADTDRVSLSFTRAINILLDSEESRLSAGFSARKMFLENYDSEVIMNRWGEEYYRVINYFSDKKEVVRESIKLEAIMVTLRFLRIIYKFVLIR